MEVGVRELRSKLSKWIEQVREGEEVVITERGLPVARLVGLSSARPIERLLAEGVVRRPSKTRKPARGERRVHARETVSELVREQRR